MKARIRVLALATAATLAAFGAMPLHAQTAPKQVNLGVAIPAATHAFTGLNSVSLLVGRSQGKTFPPRSSHPQRDHERRFTAWREYCNRYERHG